MIWGITLILLSIIAVPSLILAKKPNAKELLEKVEPYHSGLINKLFLSKNAEAKAKAEELRAKIAPKQGKLGIVGIIVGIWMIVASFLWTVA